MKKLLLFVLAVIGFAACTNDAVKEQSSLQVDAPETITVGFEGDDETRIQLNEAQKTVWTEGDLVSVFYFSDANQKWQFQGETGDRIGNLKRVNAGVPTRQTTFNVVAYPYNEDYFLSIRTGALHASLPATQHYLKDSYGVGDNLMVARSEFTQFSLKSVCGWLKLQLTGEGEVVKSITFRGNNGEQVAGLVYVDTATAEATLASEMGSADDNNAGGNLVFDDTIFAEVTLDCGEGVTLGAEATAFYIALPPQTFEEGFTVDVICADGTLMAKSSDKRLSIERNHIQPMAAFQFAATGTTNESNKSDLKIEIKVTDVTQYNAMLTVTPSKRGEEYACVFLAASQLPPLDSEYEQMIFIIENFDPAIFSGPFSEALTPLMPGTEYVVVAFGIENSLPTTDMFAYRFTSLEAGTSEVYIESIEIVKLFDAEEIIALDSSYTNTLAGCECVAIVEAKTNIPTDRVRFWWYEEWMRVEYSEEAFLDDLLMYDYTNNPEVMDMYYSLDDEDRFLFAGIAEDDKGNMSEIFYTEPFMLTKDMCDPAEEFFTMGTRSNMIIFKR